MTLVGEAILAEEVLYNASQWWIFAVLLVVLLVATEVGVRTGHSVRRRLGD
ncbi:MAG: hypothetical protein IT386_08430, partial [Deltaproteobacteria bacterium]|nr:hypothetical protein [Deltaproteobacteria bacterium]